MKLKFVNEAVDQLPIGTIVEGYRIAERSPTGKSAIAYSVDTGRAVLLIHVLTEPIVEVRHEAS